MQSEDMTEIESLKESLISIGCHLSPKLIKQQTGYDDRTTKVARYFNQHNIAYETGKFYCQWRGRHVLHGFIVCDDNGKHTEKIIRVLIKEGGTGIELVNGQKNDG